MVFGHTMHATLSLDVRAEPLIATYWQFRAVTAPLFLAVAGWAVATVTMRSRGGSVLSARWRRVLLLLCLGLLLRFPFWNVSGWLSFERSIWEHFLAFDALHGVAASLLIAALAFDLFRTRRSRLFAMTTLAITFPLVGSHVWSIARDLPFPTAMILGGSTSPFPVFPWAGFFFAGAVIGIATNGWKPERRGIVLVALSAVFLLIAGRPDGLPVTDPSLHLWRLGQVLLVLSAACVVPASFAARVVPIGKSTLGVYVIHIAIVYGWFGWPGLMWKVGRTLGFFEATALAAVVFVVSYAGARLVSRADLPKLLSRLLPTASPAPSASPTDASSGHLNPSS